MRGQYSYINAEGNEIIVRYRASKDGGFVIENEEELNESVARATADGAVAAAAARTAEHRQQFEEQQQQQQQVELNSRARLPAGTAHLDTTTKTTKTVTSGIVQPVAAASTVSVRKFNK